MLPSIDQAINLAKQLMSRQAADLSIGVMPDQSALEQSQTETVRQRLANSSPAWQESQGLPKNPDVYGYQRQMATGYSAYGANEAPDAQRVAQNSELSQSNGYCRQKSGIAQRSAVDAGPSDGQASKSSPEAEVQSIFDLMREAVADGEVTDEERQKLLDALGGMSEEALAILLKILANETGIEAPSSASGSQPPASGAGKGSGGDSAPAGGSGSPGGSAEGAPDVKTVPGDQIPNGKIADSFQLGGKTINLRSNGQVSPEQVSKVRERFETLYQSNPVFKSTVDNVGANQIDVNLTSDSSKSYMGLAQVGGSKLELNMGTIPNEAELDKTIIHELGHLNGLSHGSMIDSLEAAV